MVHHTILYDRHDKSKATHVVRPIAVHKQNSVEKVIDWFPYLFQVPEAEGVREVCSVCALN